jgi:hypothetical protein
MLIHLHINRKYSYATNSKFITDDSLQQGAMINEIVTYKLLNFS